MQPRCLRLRVGLRPVGLRAGKVVLVTAFILGAAAPANAADHEKPTEIKSLLPAKPAVLASLGALKPNHGVMLGDASVVGEFNDTAKRFRLHETGPRGRDFTIKMCWAPDRKRVLYCGANHAVPHRLNDVWEFDLPSLTWVMLYAPDLPRGYTDLGKDTSDVVFRDGILYTKRGGPAVVGHTWWGLTYDPNARRLLFMNTWVTNRKKAVEALGGDADKLYVGPPLWSFDPARRDWKPLTTEGAVKGGKPWPRPIFGGMLEYVPDLGGSIWHANNWQMRSTWLYDFKANTWRDLEANKGDSSHQPKGKKSAFEVWAPQPEQIGYYDPGRKRVIAHRHYGTHHFDPAKNAWTRMLDGNKEDGKTPYGHDAHAVFYHDPVSGHGLLVQFDNDAIWSYNPDTTAWQRLVIKGDPMPRGKKRLAYVDPASNALVVIDRTRVWAYRYRAR